MADTKLNAADDVASGCERLMAALGRLKAETAKDKPITPPDTIPEGYEWLHKEYRPAKKGEWYLDGTLALLASEDWPGNDRYIIYKIEPKFKPGDIVSIRNGCVRFVTTEGLCWPGGDLSEDNMKNAQRATDATIRNYLVVAPANSCAVFRKLAEFYAKEAKQ